MGEMRNAYRILVSKSEWKRELRTPRLRRGNYTEKDLKEIGYECVQDSSGPG
jgi:hypothetical protein